MGDVLDAVSARIKAPYFGYAVLAFIALNWRAIFMLVMTDGTPEARLEAFDAQTDYIQLIVWPLVSGAVAAVLAPWIRFLFDWASFTPLGWGALLQLQAEDRQTKAKANLERSRSALFAQQEEEVIARAKRDKEVEEIADEGLQRKVHGALEKLRNERSSVPETTVPKEESISGAAVELLKAAAADESGKITRRDSQYGRSIRGGSVVWGENNAREFSRYDTALSELKLGKYVIASAGSSEFDLTEKGWRAVESMK